MGAAWIQGIPAAIFGVWLALSVLAQFPRWKKRIRRLDPLALLPDWSFFAPTPAKGDFHVLYRDRLPRETLFTEWIELPDAGRRSLLNGVWNPDRRQRKALFDVCTELAKRIQDTEGLALQGTIPYLLLLNRVSAVEREVPVEATQFMVMMSHGVGSDKEPDILHLSALHGMDAAPERVPEPGEKEAAYA